MQARPAAAAPIAALLKRGAASDPVTQLLAVRTLENLGQAPKGLTRFGLTPDKLPEAYVLADQLMAELESPTNRRIGWKIGFSTVEGRKPLGITEPAYGPIFSSGNVSGPISTASFANLLVEQEIALVIGKDIDRPLSPADLSSAVSAVHLGFELPSKRFKGAPGAADGPTAADMVVDCLASHSFKLGPKLPPEAATSAALDLRMTRDGAPFAGGSTALLDDGRGGLGPLKALEWLIGKLLERRARRGEDPSTPVLRAGDIVYTGAIPGPLLFQANGKPQATFETRAGDGAAVALDVVAGTPASAAAVDRPCVVKPPPAPPWVDPPSNRECDLEIVNFQDLERDAKRLVSPRRYSFIEAIGDQITYRKNRSALDACDIVPRHLQGVKDVDLRTELLGHALPFPIITCPMGSHGRFHVEAENATARGTGAAGTLYVSSGAANKTMEDIAGATKGPKWFQIYMNRDPEINRWLCKRARDAGFTAIVFTVDALGASRSDDFIRHGSYNPPDLTIGNHDPKRGGRGDFRDQKRDINFDDIRFLREASGLPVVVKGLKHPDDVDQAIRAGAAAVWISNHGGRQLDGVKASLALLDAAAKRVARRVPIIFDSGIRRGNDVFKALALGADVVAIGRPVLWGLINGGSRGVNAVYKHLVGELKDAMLVAGRAKPTDIKREDVG